MAREALLILGDQLFPPRRLEPFRGMPVFMAEDYGLCTRYKQHRHKLVLFLSAMRHYRHVLRDRGFRVTYIELADTGPDQSYEDKLDVFADREGLETLHGFEVADRFFEQRLSDWTDSRAVEWRTRRSPMFMTHREDFDAYLKAVKRPFMKTFYERQRRGMGLLVDSSGHPVGGRYSFDADNRRRLPDDVPLPGVPRTRPDDVTRRVMEMVNCEFADHPGDAAGFGMPVTRAGWLARARRFVENRLASFGPYQDALTRRDPFVFHAVLSPGLNLGLITPHELVDKAVAAYERGRAPLNSVEGFVRQIVGWREFVHGMHRHYADDMASSNFWGHHRSMATCWYDGTTGLAPLDYAINKAVRYGYCHHIERLMVLANAFNLAGIHPREVYRWFMEMFVDSADWVMQANVYGMGLMSDGGLFATKPYISGANYLRKMGDFPRGEWEDTWDGLYWRFVEEHRRFFEASPRMSMAVRNLDRLAAARRRRIYAAADEFISRATVER